MSGHLIDQRDIRLIVLVADGLSISKAAKAIGVGQPGMSIKLKQVEKALGYDIFIRSGRHIVGLTKAGRDSIEAIRQIDRLFAGIQGRDAVVSRLSRHDLVKSITNDLARLSDLAAKGEQQ